MDRVPLSNAFRARAVLPFARSQREVGGRRSGGGSKLVQTGKKTSFYFPVIPPHPYNEDSKGQRCALRCAVLSLRQDGNEIVDGGT
ncbi:hypothetical protein KOW79_009761 [Hemibagrus wyckioides]|uniref:Uncharacterized protein n=1 Tax=Hemibagrus wyckioides TaxID=337641 RepID=A0A9D3SJV4_9TELE|nr:hypothetical protein KOW79_009761 [Hemibagrus wyckioides]